MTEAERSAQLARHRALGHRIRTADEPYQAGNGQAGQRLVHVDAMPCQDTSLGRSRWNCPHCGLTFVWPPVPRTPVAMGTDTNDAPSLRPVGVATQHQQTEAGRP
jgi:hypothetical protein